MGGINNFVESILAYPRNNTSRGHSSEIFISFSDQSVVGLEVLLGELSLLFTLDDFLEF